MRSVRVKASALKQHERRRIPAAVHDTRFARARDITETARSAAPLVSISEHDLLSEKRRRKDAFQAGCVEISQRVGEFEPAADEV